MPGPAIRIALSRGKLDPASALRGAAHRQAGAIALFVGTTRASHQGRKVRGLEYQAHRTLALKSLQELCREAARRFGLHGVVLRHRLGPVPIGQASVIIAVSAEHRAEAFAGCRFLIDELKTRVPIWKKERFAGRRAPVWVGPDGRPIRVR